MHLVCCCSLPVWRRSSLKKGTPRDLFWPRPGSAPGRIWPKNNNTCKGPWVLHPYQVSSKSIQQFWRSRKCEKFMDGQTDGWRTDGALWQKLTRAFGSGELKKENRLKLIKMDISLHMWITVRKNERNWLLSITQGCVTTFTQGHTCTSKVKIIVHTYQKSVSGSYITLNCQVGSGLYFTHT